MDSQRIFLMLFGLFLIGASLATGLAVSFHGSPSSTVSIPSISTPPASEASSDTHSNSGLVTTFNLAQNATATKLIVDQQKLVVGPGCLELMNFGYSTSVVTNDTFFETSGYTQTLTSSTIMVIGTITLNQTRPFPGQAGCEVSPGGP